MVITRRMVDWSDRGPVQAGVAIYRDGERLAEAWEPIGPFDAPAEAMTAAELVARNLMNGQMAGQLLLLDVDPLA